MMSRYFLLPLAACLCVSNDFALDSLYDRLGGQAGVAKIADTVIDRVAADPVAGRSFKDTKQSRIKSHLADQLCELSGGPCHYDGDSMKEVHAGHHISEAEFYRMVDVLRDVMKEQHVDLRARNELLRILAPMKRDVVEHGRADEKPAELTAGTAR